MTSCHKNAEDLAKWKEGGKTRGERERIRERVKEKSLRTQMNEDAMTGAHYFVC